MFDPIAAKFARSGRELFPWEISRKKFDFDKQFVAHIKKYLKDKELPSEMTDALAWLNRAEYDAERHDRATLLWMDFDERRNRVAKIAEQNADLIPIPRDTPPTKRAECVPPPWAGAKTKEEKLQIMRQIAQLTEKMDMGGSNVR